MINSLHEIISIDQGDLVFVTGIAMRDEDQLLLLTHLMYDRKASGIVFATGPYIAKIPEREPWKCCPTP